MDKRIQEAFSPFVDFLDVEKVFFYIANQEEMKSYQHFVDNKLGLASYRFMLITIKNKTRTEIVPIYV